MSQESLLLHGPFARKPKRIRTAFSPSQLLRLERAFEKNHYVVGAERKQLASSLSLSETQVRHGTARHGAGSSSAPKPLGAGRNPGSCLQESCTEIVLELRRFLGAGRGFFGDGELLLLAEQCFGSRSPAAGLGLG